MTAPVTIVDYGAGNILSIRRAFEHFGVDPTLAIDAETIAQAERLVLPGVGAFGACMAGLDDAGLTDAVKRYARNGRPLLGICVGMQMLFEQSDEFGVHEGLAILPGRVTAIPEFAKDGTRRKRPIIGWHSLEPAGGSWSGGIFDATEPGIEVYFVHSFSAQPSDAANLLAAYRHHGDPITAAVQRGQVYGLQFHPEKSGPAGLAIIRAFLCASSTTPL